MMRNTLKQLPEGNKNDIRIWPETAMYRTKVAQQFAINERIGYRPQMAFWLQLYERLGTDFVDKCAIATEAYLDTGDRDCFPHDFKGAKVDLAPASQPLTVIIVAGNHSATVERSIRSLLEQKMGVFDARVCSYSSVDDTLDMIRYITDHDPRFTIINEQLDTPAAAANRALQGAAGEMIALWDLSTISRPWRFSEQMSAKAGIVGSEYAELSDNRFQPLPSELLLHTHTTRLLNPALPECTLMFDRQLVLDAAFDPALSTAWRFAFQSRLITDNSISVAKSHAPLVTRLGPDPEETMYGSYYTTMVRRDVIDWLGKGHKHEWPE